MIFLFAKAILCLTGYMLLPAIGIFSCPLKIVFHCKSLLHYCHYILLIAINFFDILLQVYHIRMFQGFKYTDIYSIHLLNLS